MLYPYTCVGSNPVVASTFSPAGARPKAATAKAVTRLDEGRRLDFVPAQIAQVEGAPSRSQLVAWL